MTNSSPQMSVNPKRSSKSDFDYLEEPPKRITGSFFMHSWCLVTATMKGIQLEKGVRNLSLSLTEVTGDTSLALESNQLSLN